MGYQADFATAIADLLAVANTEHGPEALFPMPTTGAGESHYDHLRSGRAAVTFLRPRLSQLPSGEPTRAELASLAALRRAVRALAEGQESTFRRAFREIGSRFRYRLSLDGFAPEALGWYGLIAALLPALRELATSPERLRLCANPGCGWVFYDRSRKGHKAWCDTAACGNRLKARRYRERHGVGAASRVAHPG